MAPLVEWFLEESDSSVVAFAGAVPGRSEIPLAILGIGRETVGWRDEPAPSVYATERSGKPRPALHERGGGGAGGRPDAPPPRAPETHPHPTPPGKQTSRQ